MSNLNFTKPSYDALQELRRDVSALAYAVSLIPDEDEHHALFRILIDKLDSDTSWVYREVIKLWAEAPSAVPSSTQAA